jgi:hypothetical protein
MCFIGRCDSRRTAASPWPMKLSSICLHFLSRQFRCWPQPYAKDHVMVNIKNIRVTNMFISMLFTYSYCLGAHRRQWMPFRPPFLTECKRLKTENTSSSRINLCKRLFYRCLLNQAKPFFWIHRRRRSKRHHHGDDDCVIVVFGTTILSVLFLQ